MTGVDSEDRKPESIVNLTGWSWKALLVISMVLLALGVAMLAKPVMSTGSALPGQLLGAAIACGYIYQGPPFRCAIVFPNPCACLGMASA